MRSEIACSSNDDDVKLFRRSVSEFGVSKVEGRKKSDDSISLKPLLSVPSIYVDNVDTDSAKSYLIDSPALSEADWTGLDLNLIDVDTISMIVRNVEAFDKTRRGSDDVYSELVEVPLPKEEQKVVRLNEQKVGSPKKHDFIHNLQEKLHHLSDTLHRRESPSPPRYHAKSGEMFHGLKENVSGKIHQIAEKMHHFHLPHLPHHNQTVAENGLVGQAMQAILMEKFNIVEVSTTVNSIETNQKRKSSSSSLHSIKQKFNLFQRPRRSIDSETSSLRSISEVKALESSEKICNDAPESEHDLHEKLEDDSSLLELKVHEDSGASNESIVTVVSRDKKSVSKEDLLVSVENFASIMSTHNTFTEPTTFADTNKKPLHASLLSLSRNEQLSTSPSVKMHARTESIGCKFPASPTRHASGSVGKDSTLTAVHRRSSDSDLSVTPKGKPTNKSFQLLRTTFIHSSKTVFLISQFLSTINYNIKSDNLTDVNIEH